VDTLGHDQFDVAQTLSSQLLLQVLQIDVLLYTPDLAHQNAQNGRLEALHQMQGAVLGEAFDLACILLQCLLVFEVAHTNSIRQFKVGE